MIVSKDRIHHKDTKTQITARIGLEAITRIAFLCAFVSLWLVFLASVAHAELPEITSIQPAGLQRGTTSSLHISGKNLVGTKVFVSGSGVTVQSVVANAAGDSADVKITTSSTGSLGLREIRIGTPNGVSGPAWLWVDTLPNVLEAEPNNDIAHAQAISRAPIVVNGAIGSPGDNDVYSIEAKAGETWVIEVASSRIYSPLVPVVELRDKSGSLVASADSLQSGELRIAHKFEQAGSYYVSVRATDGQMGGPAYAYRLSVGVLPLVTSVSPHGEKPGRKVALQLTGVNLGSTHKTVVDIPADAPAGLFWTTTKTATGFTLPFALIVDFAPVVGLTETDALMPLPTLPCSLEGSFIAYPRLRFAFQASPKDTLTFDMYCRRIGSRADGVLRITTVEGKEIASSSGAKSGVEAEATIQFTPTEEGIYVIELSDRENKVGADRFYRLSIQRKAPGFKVFVNADRINIPVGGQITCELIAERLSGFDGPITVTASGLPKGITSSAVIIPAGQTNAVLTLSATANAPRIPSLIIFSGSATIDKQIVKQRVYPRWSASKEAGGTAAVQCELLPLGVLDRAN
jgi:hypothetical protein